MLEPTLSVELREQVTTAIRAVRQEIRWKPGKDVEHLQTRKDWGHLPADATLDDYHATIKTVVENDEAQVFLYHYRAGVYPTVVAEIGNAQWLVMFDMNGIMETAFVIEWPERYLTKREFELIGSLAEVLHDERS